VHVLHISAPLWRSVLGKFAAMVQSIKQVMRLPVVYAQGTASTKHMCALSHGHHSGQA